MKHDTTTITITTTATRTSECKGYLVRKRYTHVIACQSRNYSSLPEDQDEDEDEDSEECGGKNTSADRPDDTYAYI